MPRAKGTNKSPREPDSDGQRVQAILKTLERTYPGATTALDYRSPFQLLVATILSAQCTDERVNRVTPELFAAYPSPAALAGASLEELENRVRSTGFFRAKARSIQGASRVIAERYGGEVPRSMEQMVALPGVARKTANVVLGTAYGLAAGIAVDTHVKRVAFRLGLTEETDPEKIERDLMRVIPQSKWTDLSHQLILHGRQICHARRPACPECPLAPVCPRRGVTER